MLTAIITLSPDDNTLGSLRAFLTEVEKYAVPDNVELLDGGHVEVAGDAGASVGTYGNNVAAVKSFVSNFADLPDETALRYATDLGVDLPVFTVGSIFCGEHIGTCPENVIVTVNPHCNEAHD